MVVYFLLYDVIIVSVDLLVDPFSLFVVIQFSNQCKYVACFMFCYGAVGCIVIHLVVYLLEQ